MEMNDLLSSIKRQFNLLKNFLEILKIQQKAIVENDIDLLESATMKESEVIKSINEANKDILKIIHEKSVQLNFDSQPKDLSEFLDLVSTEAGIDVSDIQSIRQASKPLAEEIIKVNEQNKILIQEGRSFIKNLIGLLAGGNNSQLLDRRM